MAGRKQQPSRLLIGKAIVLTLREMVEKNRKYAIMFKREYKPNLSGLIYREAMRKL